MKPSTLLWEISRKKSSEPYYDLIDDWDLIVSSFLSQYGIRLSTKQFETVSWDEFISLLKGISPDTALGRVVEIRAEKNKDILKNFTPDQMRIHEEWARRNAEKMTAQQYDKEMQNLERMIAEACR